MVIRWLRDFSHRQYWVRACKEIDHTGLGKARACNSVKFETDWNLLPVLKIVAKLRVNIVAMHMTRFSSFSTVQQF